MITIPWLRPNRLSAGGCELRQGKRPHRVPFGGSGFIPADRFSRSTTVGGNMDDVQVPLLIDLNTLHAGKIQQSVLFQFAGRIVDVELPVQTVLRQHHLPFYVPVLLLGIVNIAFTINVHPGVDIPPARQLLPEMCSFVIPSLDGILVYKQLMRSRGREGNRLAGPVKSQNADAFLTEFPPVNPAVPSEDGIQEQGLLRMRESALEIGGAPRRDQPTLLNIDEVRIPCLQDVPLLIQAIDGAELLVAVSGIVFHIHVPRLRIDIQDGQPTVLSRIGQRSAVILPLCFQREVCTGQLLQTSRTVAVGHPDQR